MQRVKPGGTWHKIINDALSNNPYYLEWLKIQKWDGILPLVTGGDGATPFIEIPTNRP